MVDVQIENKPALKRKDEQNANANPQQTFEREE